MDRLVAIGDIHGCLHTLKDLLRMVSYSSQTDTLVFVGDYIDRGRFSCEVVNMLMKLQQQLGKDKVVCLRGNHEQMAIDAYRHGESHCGTEMAEDLQSSVLSRMVKTSAMRSPGLKPCLWCTTHQKSSSVTPALPIPY